MSRHKSRVTRRGRHSRKGRVGSRKRSGGFFEKLTALIPNFLKPKPPTTDPNAAPAAPPAPPAAPPAAAVDPNAAPPADPNAASAADKKGLFGLSGGSRKKSRKTCHRRRHHRK